MTAPAATPRAATVEFDHVTKAYGPSTAGRDTPVAVDDLSLSIPAGRICVLVGPSGCGKTTTLKMVNRLIEPTAGRVLLDGVDIVTRDLTDLRRGIGYVIQHAGLFPHQTIAENVATVPRLLGWPAARVTARTGELLAMVGLDPATYAGRYPAQLSGGERQRVGVARALAADPPVMLMDEPFGAVDPIVRERLQDELLRLQEQLAKTILFVTHDVDEAVRMGDLVAVLGAGGRLQQVGTPAEILASPTNDLVASFVGADRGLRRLSLFRVGDLPVTPVTSCRPGDDGPTVRRLAAGQAFEHVLVVDEGDRPLGWIQRDRLGTGAIGTDQVESRPTLLDRRATLRDALSLLLGTRVQAGIVTDEAGARCGMLRIADIVARMREADVAPGG